MNDFSDKIKNATEDRPLIIILDSLDRLSGGYNSTILMPAVLIGRNYSQYKEHHFTSAHNYTSLDRCVFVFRMYRATSGNSESLIRS